MKRKPYTFLVCLALLWAEMAGAQERSFPLISGNYQSAPLKEILAEIEAKSHATFSYIDQLVDSVFVTTAFQNKKLSEALKIILKDTRLSFKIAEANNVILFQTKEQPQEKYSLSGTIIDQQTEERLPYVNVIVREFLKGAASDSSGFYKIESLEAGSYDIDFAMLGYKKLSKRIKIAEDLELNVAIKQQPLKLEAIEITPAVIEISAEAPSMHILSAEEILSSTNFQKDVYRSVQVLPGIANTDFSAKPHIKGGNPDETAVFLDNMPIFEPFHLEDLNDGAYSIINTEPVQHLRLLTGGFSAKYPERMSGIIDVKTIDAVRERAFNLTADYFFFAAFFNRQLTDKLNCFLSARRTTFDWLPRESFVAVDLELSPEISAQDNRGFGAANKVAPINFDLLNKLDYRINSNHRLAFNILYALDDLDAIEGKWYFKPEYLKSVRENVYGWVNWSWRANQRFSSTNTLGLQKLSKHAEFLLDMNPFDETRRRNYDDHCSDIFTFRQQNLWRLSAAHLLELGLEANRFYGKYFYDEVRFDRLRTTQEAVIFDTLYLNTKISGHTLSGYLQDTWAISNRLDFLLGFRVSEQSFTGTPQFAPRSALKISFSEHLNLKLAYGLYYQPDNFHKLKTYLGETRLATEPEKCIHYVGGLSFAQENPTGVALTFGFDAYFKDYVRLNDDFQFDIHDRHGDAGVIDVPFNTRRGISQGVDFFIRGKFAKDHLLSLAYSFSQNRVTDDLGRIVPRDFDRTHSINVNSAFKLARNWAISALWRFHSGNPFTPATIQVFGDSTWFNSYAYFKTGPKNSARHPAYHSLDLKIQKEWQLKKVKLMAYLNLINVYNRANVKEIEFGNWGNEKRLFAYLPYEKTFFDRTFAPGISVMF